MDVSLPKGFKSFRKAVDSWAWGSLQRDNPQYVSKFTATLSESGLERAIHDAKPFLGTRPDWYGPLTAVTDVEIALDKVFRSLAFLSTKPQPAGDELTDPGAWVVYHAEHWTLAMDASLERVENVIKTTIQGAIKYKNSDWRTLQNSLLARVKRMKDEIGKVRHPLAHGLGGGITGLEEERLWEPYLAAQFDEPVDFARAKHTSVAEQNYQQTWHNRLVGVTKTILDELSSIFEELSEQPFPP